MNSTNAASVTSTSRYEYFCDVDCDLYHSKHTAVGNYSRLINRQSYTEVKHDKWLKKKIASLSHLWGDPFLRRANHASTSACMDEHSLSWQPSRWLKVSQAQSLISTTSFEAPTNDRCPNNQVNSKQNQRMKMADLAISYMALCSLNLFRPSLNG